MGAIKKMPIFWKRKNFAELILEIVGTSQSVYILKSSAVLIFRNLSKINIIEKYFLKAPNGR